MAGHMPEYKMPLSSFLNDEADRGITLDEGQLQERSKLFKKALHNASTSVQPIPTALSPVILIAHEAFQSVNPDNHQQQEQMGLFSEGGQWDNAIVPALRMACSGLD